MNYPEIFITAWPTGCLMWKPGRCSSTWPKAEENKARMHHCLTPEGCAVVPPVHDLHLTEHLKVTLVTEGLSPKLLTTP
ncbi:MAG TPA: hypothetical protein VJA64_10985 [Desulfobaccales bacterium]|nr:hypothetical protein [Desulfobaccales bacterium]